MPDYVPKHLLTYGIPPPKRAQQTPFKLRPINYGAKSDTIIHEDPGKLLGESNKKYIQQVLGSFLYYAQAIDMTILLALNNIATQQSKPTESTMKRVYQLLDYMATHTKAIISFRASNMILNIHSDTLYCSAGRGCSRAGGNVFTCHYPCERTTNQNQQKHPHYMCYPQTVSRFRSRSGTWRPISQRARSQRMSY